MIFLFIIIIVVVLIYFFYIKPAKDKKKEKQEKDEIKPPKVVTGSRNILEDGKTVEAKNDTAITAVGSNKILRKVKAGDIIGVLFGNENLEDSMLQVILPTGQKGLVLQTAIKLFKK